MHSEGKISISRINCNDREDYISIRIRDEKSHIGFIDVKMELVDFANAVTGFSNQKCKFELRGRSNVGKAYEHKNLVITVAVARGKRVTQTEVEAAVGADSRTSGWICRWDDFKNHHNWVACNNDNVQKFNVSFHRWVDDADSV
jgi:hypothetical protein